MADILRFDWANPMLVLDLRRMMRSKLFIWVGSVWLVLQLIVGLHYITSVDPVDAAMSLAGPGTAYFAWLMAGLVTVLILVMPIGLFTRVAREQRESSMELVVITRMETIQVVAGYLWSALAQMGLYLSLCFPFMVFSSLFGGPTFSAVFKAVYLLLLTGLVYHASGLMLGSFCRTPASTVVASLIFYPAHVIALLQSLFQGVVGYLLVGINEPHWPLWKTDEYSWAVPLLYGLLTALWVGVCLVIAQGNLDPLSTEEYTGYYVPHTPPCSVGMGGASSHGDEARGTAAENSFSRRGDIAVLGRRHAAWPSIGRAGCRGSDRERRDTGH